MQPTRVLVVDGYRDVADTLAFLLNSHGFDARAEYSSAAALDLARAWKPSAMVLDLMLPHMSGHDLAVNVRREVLPCPLFIAVTGYQHPALVERSRTLGFAAHLMKPCDPEQIFGLLKPDHPAHPARAA